MIGDGIATDLAAAQAVGARCVLMLTGVSRPRTSSRPSRRTSGRRPSPTDAAALAAALEALAAG